MSRLSWGPTIGLLITLAFLAIVAGQSRALAQERECWRVERFDRKTGLWTIYTHPSGNQVITDRTNALYYIGYPAGANPPETTTRTGRVYIDNSDKSQRAVRVPCPQPVAESFRDAAFFWPFDRYPVLDTFTGLNFGVSVGSLNASDTVTNKQQLSNCFPFLFCTPDPTPNPSGTVNSSDAEAKVSLGYNATVLPNFAGTGLPLIIGGEGFVGFGSSSSTVPTIFGTGGIAPPSAMVHDSTTFKIDGTGGLVGKIGTVFNAGGTPLFISFNGGIGWARTDTTLNCAPGGACFVNGIPTQSLETKNIVTGSIIGGEVSVPLFSLPGMSQLLPQAPPVLRRVTMGFEYTFFDGGHVRTTMGMPSQLQIAADQHITYSSYLAKLAYSFPPSDIRLKRDIASLRRLDNGLELYRFRYLWSDTAYVGVMAQEVERVRPDAVMRGADGYLRVNYDALGLKFQTYEEWVANDAQ